MPSSIETELLETAIDLFKQSDGCAKSEPLLARRYAHQGYRLGAYSECLCHRIAQERIRLIRQASDQEVGLAHKRDGRRPSSDRQKGARQTPTRRRIAKVSIVILVLLASALLTSTPIREDPQDQRLSAATRLTEPPL